MAHDDEPRDRDDEAPLSWREVAKSIAAAFFGVQTEANRRRDFKCGRLLQFVIAGWIVTVVFVLVLVGAVQLILASANA